MHTYDSSGHGNDDGKVNYRKLGNFHVEIIHVLNIHINLFLWIYGTHENILTRTYFNTDIYYHCTVDMMHKY